MASPIRDAGLNDAQAAAVEHGDAPLLVIAGAGSGKTNTLAHRVAHLVLKGADPKRILLATFSRRAAAELNRRVERILRRDLGPKPPPPRRRPMRARSTRSARGCCANMPRASASIRNFTIHDREDSADLMNLRATSLGLIRDARAVPDQGDLHRHLLARGQRRRRRWRRRSGAASPGQPPTRRRWRSFSRPMSRPSSRRTCSITTICCSICAQALGEPTLAEEIAGRFDHGAGRRVPGHQFVCKPRSCWSCGPRGRGLTVVGDDAQSIYSFRAATVRNILDFPQSSIRRPAS